MAQSLKANEVRSIGIYKENLKKPPLQIFSTTLLQILALSKFTSLFHHASYLLHYTRNSDSIFQEVVYKKDKSFIKKINHFKHLVNYYSIIWLVNDFSIIWLIWLNFRCCSFQQSLKNISTLFSVNKYLFSICCEQKIHKLCASSNIILIHITYTYKTV